MELHPDVQELADLLARIEALLRTHDASFWADEIGLCRASVEASDAYGLKRFLSMFGGMGSLNDLVLQPGGVPLTTENDHSRRCWKRRGMWAAPSTVS
jgi:hypothetical protein